MLLLPFLVASADPAPLPAYIADYYREALRDYDSAKIERHSQPRLGWLQNKCGWLQRGCKSEKVTVTFHCYKVNAKNAYGAYTGWTYWYLASKDDSAIISAGTERRFIEQYCGFDPVNQP